MKQILLLLTILITISCTQHADKESGYTYDSAKENKIKAIALRYLAKRYDTMYHFQNLSVIPSSEKDFWELNTIASETLCPGKKEEFIKMSNTASNKQDIYMTLPSTFVYNHFTKQMERDHFMTPEVFIDKDFKVLLINCDTGLMHVTY
jgi:hypothetical protein